MPGKHLQRGGINTIKRYYMETLFSNIGRNPFGTATQHD